MKRKFLNNESRLYTFTIATDHIRWSVRGLRLNKRMSILDMAFCIGWYNRTHELFLNWSAYSYEDAFKIFKKFLVKERFDNVRIKYET